MQSLNVFIFIRFAKKIDTFENNMDDFQYQMSNLSTCGELGNFQHSLQRKELLAELMIVGDNKLVIVCSMH